jgi:arylsulfatase A-like enzyme
VYHGKESLYQGGVHVPMFVSGTGVSRIGETESALVNVIDIYATVLELSGVNLPGGIYNSLSFKRLLTSSTLPKRQYDFSEIDTNKTLIHKVLPLEMISINSLNIILGNKKCSI